MVLKVKVKNFFEDNIYLYYLTETLQTLKSMESFFDLKNEYLKAVKDRTTKFCEAKIRFILMCCS